MSLQARVDHLRLRLDKARELYPTKWGKNAARDILIEIGTATPGNWSRLELRIEAARDEGNTYEEFRLLGTAATQAINDLQEAATGRYDVDLEDRLRGY